MKKMELKDITTVEEFKNQLSIYGVIVEQLADNLQDLSKVDIDKKDEVIEKLNNAQSLLYQASRELGEVKD